MSEGPVVETREGPVRGIRRDHDVAFLGIPYAAPPTGERRFLAPQPVRPWTEVRDATRYGPTPQRREEPNALIPEPSIPGAETLNLNVFTPAADDGGRPVLVWIHGGGFSAGSAASPWYDGGTFTRDGVVVVTLSYRLGFDGFGVIDGAPDNRGVRDWIAALEWVQRNIAAFGGSPDRVTIGGHSAGGGAVLALLGMPAAQHLFGAVMSFSGAIADIPRDLARQRSIRLAEMVGVEPTLDGFRGATERELTRRQYQASLLGKRGLAATLAALRDGLPWGPVIDGELIPQPTVDSFRDGVGADKPLLLGATDDEFTTAIETAPRVLRRLPRHLLLRIVERDAGRRRSWRRSNRALRRNAVGTLGRYVADEVFRSLVVAVAEARRDAPTWVYRFAWVSPTLGWSCHCLDVPFWWDVLHGPRVAPIAGRRPPQRLADEMHGAAAAFVRQHDPGWPAWASTPGTARVFGADEGPEVSSTAYDGAVPLV
ncbi:carboxylesterase/lipase family protein [Microbacterium sp. EF45047]|uniref:carboxylesterase/lipase family protein n=1 Tax=Microbacterium sp. EF45047 TaxID=2809708 RepID=UPI0023493384|nr:carboxylesterase family protein [Microbacterium sp. EF45047]WCM55452.1 carboxylesterase family protein [Microbacterium sp. EF45047]